MPVVGSWGPLARMDWIGLATGPFVGGEVADPVAEAPAAGGPEDTMGLTLGEAPMEAGHGKLFGTMPPIGSSPV